MYTSCNISSSPLFGKKVSFYTLGCKLNFSETSSISRQFVESGFEKVDFAAKSDVVVINTCSVTDNADKKCSRIVKQALKISPTAFIIIIGCYAQLKPEEVSSIPGVDAVLGAKEKFNILKLINDFTKKDTTKVFAGDIKDVKEFVSSFSIGDRTRTFLKIQDGCNYKCAFCTIPLARGRSRSTPSYEILQQIKKISALGTKEVVLTGINLGDYGIIEGRRKTKFLDLMKKIEDLDCGIERYRISSIEPNLLSDDIITLVSQSKKFVPHFHIPLQSGNDKVLKAMRRRYSSSLYCDRLNNIFRQVPDCCIGADVIVGFPGEKEEHFLETYGFLLKSNVHYLHVFPYSERANTDAIQMEGVVTQKEKTKRAAMLRILSVKKMRNFYIKYLNSERKVLFEHENINGQMLGFTDNYIRVTAPFSEALCNKVLQCKLKAINDDDVVTGEIV